MVYVFLADGFEEMEALCPVDVLRRAGIDVKTVGVGSEIVNGTHNIPVKADITLDEVKLDDSLEMIVFPGGMPGADNLEKCDEVQAALDFCVVNDKYVAAICAAPMILGHKGLLAGKNAVCFPGFESELYGADISANGVEADGDFVTGRSAGVALQFALKLVEVLRSKEDSEALRSSLKC
ncbi:MAG: DJ-1/PfpI family protein [Ruminococcus sp.]|nr:DJ-1/PfpI family protein [Ruminococcus sp.]